MCHQKLELERSENGMFSNFIYHLMHLLSRIVVMFGFLYMLIQ